MQHEHVQIMCTMTERNVLALSRLNPLPPFRSQFFFFNIKVSPKTPHNRSCCCATGIFHWSRLMCSARFPSRLQRRVARPLSLCTLFRARRASLGAFCVRVVVDFQLFVFTLELFFTFDFECVARFPSRPQRRVARPRALCAVSRARRASLGAFCVRVVVDFSIVHIY